MPRKTRLNDENDFINRSLEKSSNNLSNGIRQKMLGGGIRVTKEVNEGT